MKKTAVMMSALLLVCTTGCKSQEEKPADKNQLTVTAPPPAKATNAPAAPAAAQEESPDSVTEEGNITKVLLTATDAMTFGSNEIKVKAGQTVQLELRHTGKLPEAVMGHNFVLLAQGTDFNAFSVAAMNAKDTGYIPEDQKDKVLAHTKIIGGGASDSIEFAAPAAGTYDFLCTFPGHAAMMKGKFIVE